MADLPGFKDFFEVQKAEERFRIQSQTLGDEFYEAKNIQAVWKRYMAGMKPEFCKVTDRLPEILRQMIPELSQADACSFFEGGEKGSGVLKNGLQGADCCVENVPGDAGKGTRTAHKPDQKDKKPMERILCCQKGILDEFFDNAGDVQEGIFQRAGKMFKQVGSGIQKK